MAFEIDVVRRRGEAEIRLAFAAGPGLVALFGPSGVGKTSVLDMVAGLLRPDTGTIRVADETLFGPGVDLAPERRRAGYVFQDGRLFPHRTVRANLRYGLRADGWMGFDEAVAFLGLGDLLDRRPATLSGGEAKRVAIGRALLSGPRFLLMDEPLVSLDAARAEEVMRVVERIRDELELPILYVTHDRREVDRLATEVVEMAR
jgi:molybdate transport system ATP-binding protein